MTISFAPSQIKWTISFGLFHAGSLTPFTSQTVEYNTSKFADPGLFYDFTLSSDVVQAGDAWAGESIGVVVEVENGNALGAWSADNIRLTAVPEPSTIALIAVGLGGVFVMARRKRSA